MLRGETMNPFGHYLEAQFIESIVSRIYGGCLRKLRINIDIHLKHRDLR